MNYIFIPLIICIHDAFGAFPKSRGVRHGKNSTMRFSKSNNNYTLSNFLPYTSQDSCYNSLSINKSHCNISIAYIVVTGSNRHERASLVWNSWTKNVCAPHHVKFITDGSKNRTLTYPSLIAYELQANASVLVHYRKSQFKWFYAINIAQNWNISFDWLYLVDDDSLVLHHSLVDLLNEYNSSEPILIGKKGNDCDIMCGGPGLALSRPLLQILSNHMKSLQDLFESGAGPHKKIHSDVVLSHFIRDNKLGKLVHRIEFKNHPPKVSLRWHYNLQSKMEENATLHAYDSMHTNSLPPSLYRSRYPPRLNQSSSRQEIICNVICII
eukprot:gene2857-5617_t